MMSMAFEEILGKLQVVSTRSKHSLSDGLLIFLSNIKLFNGNLALQLDKAFWNDPSPIAIFLFSIATFELFNSSELVFTPKVLFEPSCFVILTFLVLLLISNATANSTIVATTKKRETNRYTPSLSMFDPVGESFLKNFDVKCD